MKNTVLEIQINKSYIANNKLAMDKDVQQLNKVKIFDTVDGALIHLELLENIFSCKRNVNLFRTYDQNLIINYIKGSELITLIFNVF